ncbi:MAG: hypothetical protein ACHQDF_01320 [Chitinophagales bacterium]
MDSLSQKTRLIDLSRSAHKSLKPEPDHQVSANRLKIKESISWSICFAIVAGVTGALLVYKIGVTMSLITSILFYFSLLGFVAFVARTVRLHRPRREDAGEVESKHLFN